MPISLDLWLAFCVASALAIAIPGPTMLLAIGNSLGSGPRIGFASLLGVGAADAAGMTVSVLGLSALLATVSLAFEIVKWLGAAYLVWLGIQLWRAPVAGLDARPEKRRTASRAILRAFIAHLLNPKGILFFGAFLPQFIDTGRSTLPQFATLGATFILLDIAILSIYVVIAGRGRQAAISPLWQRRFNRTGGGMLIGAGLFTATLQRQN
ncbi:LysE family translocator [Ferrovibrio sp.]|uniref:LysE family translocator n=1 Tax=Ferrovibrio sp. TaxID=1917215 RepID=UPI002603A422|nr:LysE family translocator [Ferrovibrio sp.]